MKRQHNSTSASTGGLIRCFPSALPILVILLIPSAKCFSQEAAEKDTVQYELQDFVVVGTRTTEKIIDIPYSVFKVDREELTYGRKISADDVLTDVPGLFLQSRYGNQDMRISIRGFGTRSSSGIRGVRVLQDGIPESDPDGQTVVDAVDFASLGSVEVVKSNVSSLYANAPGGVINFVSDIYFPEPYVAQTNQFGQYGLRRNGFRTGYRTDDYRFLLSYSYMNLGGYRPHSSEFQHLFNTVYEGHLGPNSSISVFGNYVDGVIKLPGSLTQSQFEADPFQADSLALSQDYRRNTRKGRLAVRFKTLLGDKGDVELEVTGYGGLKDLEEADNLYVSTATRYSLGSLVRMTDKFSLLERLNTLSFGMEYAAQSGPETQFDNLFGNRGPSVENEFNGSLSNIGFYILDHLNLVPERLDLFVSGRFDKDVFERDIYIPFGFTDSSRAFQKFTPKAGVNFKLNPSVALYTSYGAGYDFPGLSELDNTPLTSNIKYTLNPDLRAQQSTNFECGIKGDIVQSASEGLKKLFFDIALFDYVVSDEIVPFVINQTTYYRNAAKTDRKGIEAAVKARLLEGAELTVNYTYADFVYDDYQAVVYTPSGPVTQAYTKNVVPSVPRHLVNFILNYEVELSQTCSGLLQWDCDYVARMFVNDANSATASEYFYANPMVGASFSAGKFRMTAFCGIANLFDRRYAGFINTNDYYGKYYEAGEPRATNTGLNLSMQF